MYRSASRYHAHPGIDWIMPLHFERLEDRRLLAAGISLAGGTLKIEGDNNANNIFVHGDEEGLIYAGLDRNGDGDFDDAGDVLKVYESDLIKSIVINSKGGDDMVLVDPHATITGDLVVNTGAGSDIVEVLHVAARDIRINTGHGHDQAGLIECFANRDVTVNTGAGDDLVVLAFADVSRNLTINTAAGDDALILEVALVDGKVDVKLGAGDDLLISQLIWVATDPSKVKIDGGAGQDRLVVASEQLLQLLTDAGAQVKNFEIIENSENMSPTTTAKFNLVNLRYDSAEHRLDQFHEVVENIVEPSIP